MGVQLNFASHGSFLRVLRKVGMESKHKKVGCRSVLGLSKKRWSHRLTKSQFSIFGTPRSVIMTIIGIKTNKIARQNIFLRKPYEGPFLSWFFSASHYFGSKFLSLFLWMKFHYTLRILHSVYSLNILLRLQFLKILAFSSKRCHCGLHLPNFPPPPLPLPLLFPFQPDPSIIPDIPSSYPALHNPTSYLTFTMKLVSIHEVMF